MILTVLLISGAAKTEGHDEKNNARYLEPQLMQHAPERARCGTRGAHCGGECATSSGLLPDHTGHNSDLSPSGNLAHDLDFNSLRRYNDATLRWGETVLPRWASNQVLTMQTSAPDFTQLKSGLKTTWMAGDFGQIAHFTAKEAENFVGRIGITPGSQVLDVACGTGNTSIPAAKTGASVTGVDIATNLLEQARKRSASEHLQVRFEEGDAEDLPYADSAFDVVLTMFGAMFAPRPEKVAAELLRVCKPGGIIAMANWTPQGFVGKSFQVTSKLVPPPPFPPPVLWGDESVVRQRLGQGTKQIHCTLQHTHFAYPFPPRATVEFFRRYFGPTQMAFSKLDQAGQAALAEQLEELWMQHNTAKDGTTAVDGEYLEVRAIRA